MAWPPGLAPGGSPRLECSQGGCPLSGKVRGGNGVGKREKRRKKVALVCAGGGVTGAIYEIGCLRALDELLDRSVLDLDLYVGISGGAFVSSLLATGVSPREMYDEVTSRTALSLRGARDPPLPPGRPRVPEALGAGPPRPHRGARHAP